MNPKLLTPRLALLPLFCAGCAAVLPAIQGSVGASAHTAPNPLKGEPVSYNRPPIGMDLQGMTAADCTIWPLDNHYVVKATADKVCVDVVLHANMALQYEAVYVVSDGTESDKLAIEIKDSDKKKIGHCARRDGMASDVWESQGSACTPNKNLLTAKSKHLVLRKKGSLLGDSDVAAWDLTE